MDTNVNINRTKYDNINEPIKRKTINKLYGWCKLILHLLIGAISEQEMKIPTYFIHKYTTYIMVFPK